ncbi:MAG: tetratricopeptide repeat protein, partial [Candidatus Eisenbacteria bacterium]|nr:tetratricopeptide repeat protein [Candidatus Latescibacterota bacterium]MBD3303018.1 tetratricopeptide repeat protein [Candidatus Eisenbacteria bacterium]
VSLVLAGERPGPTRRPRGEGSGAVRVRTGSGRHVAVHTSAGDALRAAVHRHRDREETAPGIAVHSGDLPSSRTADLEPLVRHAEKMLEAGAAGRILVSEATAVLVRHDLDPGDQLVDLGLYHVRDGRTAERVFELVPAGSRAGEHPPLSAPPAPRTNLPTATNRFFGRIEESARLRRRLAADGDRLVTLLGTGGAGKTRLSLEVARTLLPGCAGGVWFVPLADLTDAGRIAEAVTRAVGIPPGRGRDLWKPLAASLGERRALVLLDNVEHLLPDASAIVREMLEELPTVRLLATSRRPLQITGEQVLELEPLELPRPHLAPDALAEIESVALFVDRAQAVRPDFRIGARNAEAIALLCRRLEGIPLALELAASRSQVLTPSRMLQRLEARLDFLTTRRRDVARRHRAMRSAIDWSARLLPADLRRFFCKLSVFRGDWSIEAAEEILREPLALDLLEQLREVSLLQGEERDGEIRFRMLEMVREFAEEQTTERERNRLGQAHRAFFLDLVRSEGAKLGGRDQKEGLAGLERDLDNVRAVLDRCLAASRDRPATAAGRRARSDGLEIAQRMSLFWTIRGLEREGIARLEAFLALPREGIPPPLLAGAIYQLGTLASHQSEDRRSVSLLEESLELYRGIGDREGIARALNSLGVVASNRAEEDEAIRLYEQSLAIYRELGEERFVAQVLTNLGVCEMRRKELATARRYYEESLAIKRRIGTPRDVATALNGLGNISETQGDLEASRRYHEECLALCREIGDDRLVAFCLANLSNLEARADRPGKAFGLLRESLSTLDRIGDRRMVATALKMMGDLRIRGGAAWAARILGAAVRWLEEIGGPIPERDRPSLEERKRA